MLTRFNRFEKEYESYKNTGGFWNDETSNIVSFETNNWFTGSTSLSVKPFLEALLPALNRQIKLDHHFINDDNGLYFNASSLNHGSTPFFYSAFHGFPGGIAYNDHEGSALDDLTSAFENKQDTHRVIYFGSCSIFSGRDGDFLAKRLLSLSKANAVIGYSNHSGWFEGMMCDLLFIQRFYNNENPLANLPEIYNSVLTDYAPALKIGLQLYTRKDIGK